MFSALKRLMQARGGDCWSCEVRFELSCATTLQKLIQDGASIADSRYRLIDFL